MRCSRQGLQRFVMGGVWLPLTVLAGPRFDPAFGAGGVATAEFAEPFSSLSEAHAIGVLPDGRILLVGSGNFIPTAASVSEWTVMFARLQAQGQRDASFGSGGIKPVPLASFAAAAGVPVESVAMRQGTTLPGGQVLLAGSLSTDWRLPSVPVMGRFTTEGELDPSFAGQGLALLNRNWPSGWAQPAVTSFAMQSDGGIVLLVRGTMQGTGRVSNSAWLVRLESSGQLDLAFGSEGRAEITLDAPIQSDRVLVEPGSQGGIVVALGFRESLPARQGVVVMRFDGRGVRDPEYGDGENGQIAILPAADPQPVGIRGAEMQSDGRLLLLVSIPFRSDSVVVRLDPTGQPDAEFGVDGSFWFQDTAGSRTGAGLQVDGDSGILFAGSLGNAGSSQTLRLSRLHPDGEPDRTYTQSPWPGFEEPGLFESRPLTEFSHFSVTALVPDAAGRVLLAGNSQREIVVGQDEFGADIVEPRQGFLVVRVTDDASSPFPILGFESVNYSVREGSQADCAWPEEGVCLRVRRTGPTESTVSVGYRTELRAGDQATPFADYTPVQGELIFRRGQISATIFVPIWRDQVLEEPESLSVVLFQPTEGAVLDEGRSVATITIQDGLANLAITKSVLNQEHWRQPGELAQYRVRVTNWGPLDIEDAEVLADVPVPLLFTLGLPSQGTFDYDFADRRLTWRTGPLAPRATATMTYTVIIPENAQSPTRIESSAQARITAGAVDRTTRDDVSETFLVIGGSDLAAELTLPFCDSVGGKVILRNQGPNPSGAVRVAISADDAFERFEPIPTQRFPWERDGANPDRWIVTFAEGRLASGEELVATGFETELRTNVVSGRVTFEIEPLGAGDGADPNPFNNRSGAQFFTDCLTTGGDPCPLAHLQNAFLYIVCIFAGNSDCDTILTTSRESARVRMDDGVEPSLSLAPYYAMRAWLNQTAAGQRLTALYREHSVELTRILMLGLGTPDFLDESLQVLLEFQQGYAQLLAGQGEAAVITSEMIERLNRVADRIVGWSSDPLREAIETERARFDHLQDFVGVSFSDWGRMLGVRVPESLWLVASSAEKLEDGTHYFEVNGAPGYVYSVWQTDDPESADWRRVEDAIVEALDHTVRVRLPGASGPSNYYRVRADQVISVN